jgi:hypothetical protein
MAEMTFEEMARQMEKPIQDGVVSYGKDQGGAQAYANIAARQGLDVVVEQTSTGWVVSPRKARRIGGGWKAKRSKKS